MQFTTSIKLVVATLVFVALPAAASYEYRTIDPVGATNTALYAINNSGVFVGIYSVGGAYSGFVSDGASTLPIAFPSSLAETFPYGINDRGDIVGSYITNGATGQEWRAFVRYADGTYSALPELPVANVFMMRAAGINNNGDIVGTYITSTDTDGWGDGFLYRNGTYELFENIWPNDINDEGAIAATVAPYNGLIFSSSVAELAFRYPDETMLTIGYAIDAAGNLAGTSISPVDGLEKAFVRGSDGVFTAIEFPDNPRTIVTGMNDFGSVVGFYYDAASRTVRTHGFIGVPNAIPEPPALLLFAMGVVCLLIRINRDRLMTPPEPYASKDSVVENSDLI